MLDIYALAAGYYPLVGNQAARTISFNRDRYGVAASAATVANYYLSDEKITTGIPGNVAIYGELDDVNLGHIREDHIPEVEQVLMGEDPMVLLREVADDVQSKYGRKLKEVEKSGKGLTGRSMEEMQIPGFTIEGEAAGRALMDVSGPNPPDFLTKKGEGFEVTRQRLGKRGHAFIGSAATQMQKKMAEIKATSTNQGMALYEEMADAGLEIMKNRYKSFNQIIGATVKQIQDSGKKATKQSIADHFSTIKKMPTNTKAEKAASRAARSIAMNNAKGKATNYMTDQAMTHVMHHISFRNPMIDTYVIDDGIFAFYAPITQYPASHKTKMFQFKEQAIKSYVEDELLFASDSIINFDQAGMSANDRAIAAFAGWTTKNIAKHGQVIQTGEAIKSTVSMNGPKLVPSIAITQAENEFAQNVSKQLFKNANKIASEMLNDGTFLNDLSRKLNNQYSTTPVNNTEMWAQPYITAMSFREQAYG